MIPPVSSTNPMNDKHQISVSRSFDAPVQRVWQIIGDFAAVARWFPGLASCIVESIDGKTRRRVTTDDGTVVIENLVERDESAHRIAYSLNVDAGPVTELHVTMALGAGSLAQGSELDVHITAQARADGDPAPMLGFLRDNVYAIALDRLARIVEEH